MMLWYLVLPLLHTHSSIYPQMCMEQSQKLDNLATVMQLYSRGTFGKDKFQWTKCVIKYLFDVYANLGNQMIAFLVEVSEPQGCICLMGY